ncbi:MAG: hypothetical protein WCK49_03905 [Myxococcaceae bacterium]
MKTIWLTLFIFAVTFTGAKAQSGDSTDFVMTELSRIMLGNIDTDSASFTVHNPGSVSGICSLIMISTSNHNDFHDLSDLLDRFEITTVTSAKEPVVRKRFTRFPLLNANLDQMYINILKIKTKDGKSIAENIKALYKYMAPIAMTVDFCKSH